jgi:protein phosphatase
VSEVPIVSPIPESSGADRAAPGSMLDLEFAQLSDTGRVREHNEDYMGCASPETPEKARSHGWLFVVADGVGGQDRGEVASRTAVESMVGGFRSANGGELLSTLLPRLVQAANARVLDAGHAVAGGGSSMATTVVSCALRFDHVVVSHAGDSRCYLIRREYAKCLTRDHTFANEQVRLGVLSVKEAAESPTRHVLSRSLGADMFVGVETSEHQVAAGDVLLLCSDGLYGPVKDQEIADIAGHGQELGAAAARLVELANERGGGDNVSVQLIRVRGVERVGMYRGRPYRLR